MTVTTGWGTLRKVGVGVLTGTKRGRTQRRRGSFFFVLDAFIAASILIFTLVLIFSFYAESRRTQQSVTYAQDYLAFLMTTQVNDYRVPSIMTMISSGAITNPRVTLAEQLLIFNANDDDGDDEYAETLLELAAMSIPSTVDISVTLLPLNSGEGTERPPPIYARSSSSDSSARQTHLSAKSLAYAVGQENELYGPFILEVETWS